MPNLLNCKVSVSVSNLISRLEKKRELWVFVTPKGNPKKILGQGKINDKGQVDIKIKVSGIKPIDMDVIVYPLSHLANIRRIKPEKKTITKWKSSARQFSAAIEIDLSTLF